jgi:hypothetical protein
MVALLVGLSIMGGLMTIAMPVWTHAARREKEAELIFRGEQYMRAIALFQRRSGPGTLPPDVDVLVRERFLRKRYRDPITGGDFLLVRQGQTAGAPAPGAQGGIVGVVSASRDESIRLYHDRNHYNEWQFIHVPQTQTPGADGGPGRQNEGRLAPSASTGRGAQGGQVPVGRGSGDRTPPGDRGGPP